MTQALFSGDPESGPPPTIDENSSSQVPGEAGTAVMENLGLYLEALLFVAPGEVNPAQLAAALDVSLGEIERGLEDLERKYTQASQVRGIRLQRHRGRFQLTTAPQASSYVERFLGLETTSRLSRAGLETLAIVLYSQPVTRPQIDAIRGVRSDAVLHSLLLKDLVQEIGRAEAPGRPILYSATPECLQYFGISSLAELPPLELEDLEPAAEST